MYIYMRFPALPTARPGGFRGEPRGAYHACPGPPPTVSSPLPRRKLSSLITIEEAAVAWP